MSSYEFSGKTVKEAVEKACAELQVDESALDVEVLEECSRGFLGLVGQRDARVRVTTRESIHEVAGEGPTAIPRPVEDEGRAPSSADVGMSSDLEDHAESESVEFETATRSTEASPALDQATEVLEGIFARTLHRPQRFGLSQTVRAGTVHRGLRSG